MANQPSASLTFDPPGNTFAISQQCEMPNITVSATLNNVNPSAMAALKFQWTVTLVFTGYGCPHSMGRIIKHPLISRTTTTNTLKLPFTAIRGGALTVSLRVQVGTVQIEAASQNLQVVGTNPNVASLAAYVDPCPAFRKLMRVESRLRQFLSPAWPYFSEDNFGGVGICQMTDPPPTDDQVWNWQANVDAGWSLFQDKERIARTYPRTVRTSQSFQKLTQHYNDIRYAKARQTAIAVATVVGAAKPAVPHAKEIARKDLTITIPDFTDDQLQLDTIRGFNGYADGLHEYRPLVDPAGLLVVKVDEPALTGTAGWERISTAQRIAQYDADSLPVNRRGDPGYVDDVTAMPSF